MRRSNKIKVGLAGLAVLGVGFAATSALWSDNVWFQGTATTSAFNLQGSVTDPAGTPTWEESATEDAITLTIPAAENLSPGTTVDRTVWVRNDTDSDVAANLAAPTTTVASDDADLQADLSVTVAYGTPSCDVQGRCFGDTAVKS
ncbi:hypothetical protein GCM10025864_21260 [Luteimicrobium album]|uniref:Ribosomally synthesized peptide with SipW-like signal peptide n=1 Tax=Luteimicrobium album TaxID=1054550 RepID=A0ABQ6I1M5_9MICO|nr:hypothetical protein [Luteimicrobium album]GMA24367.1 hypothetical protein GCM10025864_21260 [Luteimicrobium album]